MNITEESRSSFSAQADEAVVSVRDISKVYPGTVALAGVDLDLRRGEVHALLGENGAGKSTLINILSGTVSPSGGSIQVSGSPVSFSTPNEAHEFGIATVHQEQSLIPNLTAVQNIFLGREMLIGARLFTQVLDEKGMQIHVRELAEEFGLDERDLNVPIAALGALKQHVIQIIKALAFRTEVVILDEPTSGLADHERQTLFAHMRQLKARGIALLWVTHRLDEIFGLADTVTVLRDGRFIANVDPAEETPDSLVRLMVGRSDLPAQGLIEENEAAERGFTGAPEEIIRLESVSWEPFLHGISLKVFRGEILGLAGIAGAGRTETARVIIGADRQDSGRVLVRGEQTSIRSPRDAMNMGIAYVPEERKTQAILADFSIEKNMSVSDLPRVTAGRFFLNKRKESSAAKQYVASLGIKTSSVQEKIRNLSGGNQQKVIIARCLFTRPDLIIFDEPTQGVDVGAKAEVYRLIYEFVDQGGAAILISSELPELIKVSDRIAVMREGRIVGELSSTGRNEEAAETSELGEQIISLATRGATV